MCDQLQLEDLALLMDKLYEVQTKWYNIGLQLSLAVSDLETIRSQASQNEQECLREMLIKWLKTGRATTSVLCKALRNRTVGEDVLASEIEKSKQQTGQQPAGQSSASKQKKGSKTTGGAKKSHPPPLNSPPPPKRTKSQEEPKTKQLTKQPSNGGSQATKKSKKKLSSVPESFGADDFIRSQPPDRFCVKCKRVPLNPQRSGCCNRLYCKPCADKTKKCNNKTHKEVVEYSPDKKLCSNIQKLKIKCMNEKKGCKWEGEVFNLKNHLPECPHQPSSSTNSHQQAVRLNSEPSPPTFTSTASASPRLISHTSAKKSAEPGRLLLQSNSTNSTNSTTTSQSGASATLGHATHPRQRAQSQTNQIQREATSSNTVTNATPPVHLVMTNVSDHQHTGNIWVSHSFLSHQLGYRLCLAVHIGTDNQLRIGVTLTEGQQNSFLRFPCSGEMIVKIMHPLHSNTAVEVEVSFTLNKHGELFMPSLTSRSVATNDLVTRNCLFFQVSRIYLDYDCQPWLLGPNYTLMNQ